MKHDALIKTIALLAILTTHQALASRPAPGASEESDGRKTVVAANKTDRPARARTDRPAAKSDSDHEKQPRAEKPKDPGLIF